MASAVKPIDPMDRATREAAGSHAPAGEPVRSYPLRPDFLAFVQVWQQPDGVIYAAKGAPETIVDLCRLDTSERAEVHRIVSSLAELGLRVLGVASARCAQAEDRSPAAIRFEFEGLMGFLDPVRGDVPAALQEAKRAGVSVAMITGDYPASDIVLLDDRFTSIIGGIRLGRRIFANLRKALTFITAIHVPIAGLALAPILLGLPPMLLPMHVVLLELAIDPVCSLVFESERSEKTSMSVPPRAAGETLFGTKDVALGILQGVVILGAVLALYVSALSAGMSDSEARASAFVALVIGNLSLALSDAASAGTSLFDRHRIAFWSIGAAAVLVLAACLTVPALARILRFSLGDPAHLLFAAGVGLAAGSWFGVIRRLWSRSPADRAAATPARAG
jgi:magnesium-transporting ATPase (P-type)